MRTALIHQPIDASALLGEVASHANGATLLFVGTVRDVNDGRGVTGMEYTAYRAMAERELNAIAAEAASRFSTNDVVIEHRLGVLDLGEASVAIVVAHPHRGAAYEASRYIIEQLKQRVPIWKLEHYIDGTREWVGTPTARMHSGAGDESRVGREMAETHQQVKEA
jgi:molybdopterin synthase catalytic subunit